MNRYINPWFLAATILVAVGAVIFVGALATVGFDFTKLSTQKFQTNTYEFNEDFENIVVNVETATVTFVPSESGIGKIECVEEEKMTHSAIIQDGTLIVCVNDSRKWYDYIGIHLQTPTITIHLPKDVYASLSVATTTGNIEIPDRYRFDTVSITGSTSSVSCYASVSNNIELHTTTGKITLGSSKAGTVRLSATTGKIVVNDVACHNLLAKNSTGQIHLKNVIAEESIQAENTTGGVKFESCDATDITVKTSTGSVRGTLLSEKIFVTDTSTGKVSVPKTTSGGRCEITTSTGNIKMEVEQ